MRAHLRALQYRGAWLQALDTCLGVLVPRLRLGRTIVGSRYAPLEAIFSGAQLCRVVDRLKVTKVSR